MIPPSDVGRARRLAARRVLRGVWLLARFRAEGLDCFEGSLQSFVNSLAPLLAFPAVALFVVVVSGGQADDVAQLLSMVSALLLQVVLSEALARRWGREAEWGRYAAALNWCQWAVPPVAIALMLVLPVAVGAGLPPQAALVLGVVLLAGYALALQWFVARTALRIGNVRATVLVAGVNIATAAMVIGAAQFRLLGQGT